MRLGGFFAFEIRNVNDCVAGGRASFRDDVFHPGDFFAIGRDGGLFEAVRGGERVEDLLRRAGRFGFCGGGEARFGGLFSAAGLLGGSPLREAAMLSAKNKQ